MTTIKERTETVRVLLSAKALLESDGWGQGLYFGPAGPCLVGACLVANGGDQPGDIFDDNVWRSVMATLHESLSVAEGDSLSMWNDKPGRTKAQVIALLERAVRFA